MEGLAHLVAESLVRHGFEPAFDHRRLQWSSWFRCQDSFSLVLAPCKPGLFALGEEVIAPGELGVGEGKRMLALFQISEADDLGMALGRLFLSRNPDRERLTNGRCFARYVVIEDAAQRRTALAAFKRWMASSAETVTGVPQSTPDDSCEPHGSQVVQQSPAMFASERGTQKGLFASDNDQQETTFVSGHDFSRAANPATETVALAAAPADASPQTESSNKQAQIGPPSPIPSGF
jgi:hypothetical protein